MIVPFRSSLRSIEPTRGSAEIPLCSMQARYERRDRSEESSQPTKRMFARRRKRGRNSSAVPHELVKYQAVDFDGQALAKSNRQLFDVLCC